jgi:hypothetical protein
VIWVEHEKSDLGLCLQLTKNNNRADEMFASSF